MKKYFIDTSLGSEAMNSLGSVSKGSSMLMPKAWSGPAPSRPAAMIPGPAPVTVDQPCSASTAARSRAWRVQRIGRVGPGRPEHGHLGNMPVGGEHLEPLPHLPEGGADDLEIEPVGSVRRQAGDGSEDLQQLIAVSRDIEGVE